LNGLNGLNDPPTRYCGGTVALSLESFLVSRKRLGGHARHIVSCVGIVIAVGALPFRQSVKTQVGPSSLKFFDGFLSVGSRRLGACAVRASHRAKCLLLDHGL
jgi:hypothetical protein